MNNLCKKLAILVGLVGFLSSIHAVKKEPLVGNNLPECVQREMSLSIIGDFLSNQQGIEKVEHDNMICVTHMSPETKHIRIGYLDLSTKEFNTKGSALNWIKNEISVFQANLIARIYAVNRAGNAFFMDTVTDVDSLNATDNMYIWMTLPEYVRDYLVDHLNIQF